MENETPAEKDFFLMEMCNELAIVHKLPGEVRYIALMTGPGLSEDQTYRYARLIVDALNEKAERDAK